MKRHCAVCGTPVEPYGELPIWLDANGGEVCDPIELTVHDVDES